MLDRKIIEIKAKELLKKYSTSDLLDQWEMTTNITDENVYEVRGWLMDVLASRNPEGFGKWLDSEEPRDEDLRAYILA